MTLGEIEKNCEAIRKVLDEKIDRTNPEEVSGKLDALTNIQGLGAELISRSEMIYNRRAGAVLDAIHNKYKATDQKIKIQGECAQEIYFLRLAETYNKECHYQIEILRTQLSYLKEEMRQSGFSNTLSNAQKGG